MKSYHILIVVLFAIFLSCSNDDDANNDISNEFIDPRDGQTYPLVTIGTQTWFAHNLNYELENGESKCYDDVEGNCFTYGRLYDGDDALTACPEGFRLATEDDWLTLFDFLGGEETAYNFLGPYAQQQGEPINFNLLAGGYYLNGFLGITQIGRYWTSTDAGLPNSLRFLEFEPEVEVDFAGASYGFLMSCRCIKDEEQ